MRDDVMGAFGETKDTGKPVGGDLREGKPTPLLARAVGAASPAQLNVLDLVGDQTMTEQTVSSIQQVIVDTGALDKLEAHIEMLTTSAIDSLATAPITEVAKTELSSLALYVSSRAV
jgi:geranylgeranyl diphosphate synthase type I